MEIIRSTNNSQEKIISDILKLHNEGKEIDLDCTYSKGVFYKNGIVPEPKIKSDLKPQVAGVIPADSGSLPFPKDSMNCIMFDPPFIVQGPLTPGKEGSTLMFKRFSGYANYDELKNHDARTIKAAFDTLKKDGILIFKLQNTVSSGKQRMTHFFVMTEAIKQGFYPKDEFVLLSKSKMTAFGTRWKTQRHAMKYHSYFMVFKKCGININYDA